MACLGRLAGALILESNTGSGLEYYLIGNTKEPCDFPAHGFVRPVSLDGVPRAVERLEVTGPVSLSGLVLSLPLEGERCAELIAERLLIVRNVSVSDRLWRLILNPEMVEPPPMVEQLDGRWLVEMPNAVWNIVRDTVLRCV